jgi:hypothetical protein
VDYSRSEPKCLTQEANIRIGDPISTPLVEFMLVLTMPEDEASRVNFGTTTQEFVAISAGSVRLLKDTWNSRRPWCALLESYSEFDLPHFRELFTSENAVYDFFNVLHIGWDGGVAFRKAIGRLLRDIWEREATEEIDLLLG